MDCARMKVSISSLLSKGANKNHVKAKYTEANDAMVAEAIFYEKKVKAFQRKLSVFQKKADALLVESIGLIAGPDPKAFSMKGSQLTAFGDGPSDIKRTSIEEKREDFHNLMKQKVHQPMLAYHIDLNTTLLAYHELEDQRAHWGGLTRKLEKVVREQEKLKQAEDEVPGAAVDEMTREREEDKKAEEEQSRRALLAKKVELKTERVQAAEKAYYECEVLLDAQLKELIEKARGLKSAVCDAFSIPGDVLVAVGRLCEPEMGQAGTQVASVQGKMRSDAQGEDGKDVFPDGTQIAAGPAVDVVLDRGVGSNLKPAEVSVPSVADVSVSQQDIKTGGTLGEESEVEGAALDGVQVGAVKGDNGVQDVMADSNLEQQKETVVPVVGDIGASQQEKVNVPASQQKLADPVVADAPASQQALAAPAAADAPAGQQVLAAPAAADVPVSLPGLAKGVTQEEDGKINSGPDEVAGSNVKQTEAAMPTVGGPASQQVISNTVPEF